MKSHTPKGKLAREHILAAAARLLAERGYHGTSLRDVAEAAGAPLATLIYHFAKKEALYAAVLGEIAGSLGADLAAAVAGDDVLGYQSQGKILARLDAAVRVLVRWATTEPGSVALLLRELLDNESRVARAAHLPMAPVMRVLTDFVERGRAARVFTAEGAPETLVLHLVGALSYVVVSRPTIRRIVGKERERTLARTWERDTVRFARRVFGAPAPQEQQHGKADGDRAHRARPRPHRGAHDRP